VSLKKYERGAVAAVATTALTLLIGLLPFDGGAALGVGSSTPTPTPTATTSSTSPSSTGTPSASGTPSPTSSAATTSSATPITLPNAAAITAYGSPGQTAGLNVLSQSTCNGGQKPCPWSALISAKEAVVGYPKVSGVTASVVTSNGIINVAVGSGVAPGTVAKFRYTIKDKYGASANIITFTVGHAPVTPNIGKTIWTGHSISFDLLSTAKCNDLTSPCPASAVSHIFMGADPLNPMTKATATASGTVTISVGPHQYPFGHAHIPYVIIDKYGRSQGLLVVSFLDSYNPTSRYIFNNPLGNSAQQQSIDQAIVDLTNHAPKGSTIEMITYTLDGQDLTYALVNAYKRGVNVRVLQGNGIVSGNVPYLQQNLGTNQMANSFYHICRAACRSGVAGVPHTKVFAVTTSGRGSNAVVAASSNYSYGGSAFQWFDGYELVNNAAAYQGFDHVFQEARLNRRPSDWTGLNYQVNSAIMYTYPRIITSLSQMAGPTLPPCSATRTTSCYRTAPLLGGSYYDWLEQALSQVSCGASTGYGRNGRTLVRVTVRALQGARGYDVAHMLGLLARAGCDVRVITTQPSTDAVNALQAAGIWVGDQTWRWMYQVCSSDDSSGSTIKTYCWVPGLYTHMHALAVSGGFSGKQQDLVWTGSESWATDAYYNDEQVVRLSGAAYFNSFMNVFNFTWGHYVHPVGQKPQGNPPGLPAGTQLPYS